MPPGHKLSCDSRCGPDMYSPYIIGSYNFLKTTGDGWQFAKVVRTSGGCGEREVSSHHQDARLGKRFYVHLQRDELNTTDVSDDPENVVLASKSSRKLQVLYIFAVVTRV